MSRPALVLHLNGPPGVGKSTLAQRWADEHPGTLLLDIDVLRTWVSGWRDDFGGTGSLVREVALAMVTAYAAQGRDVVLPQLIANAAELARFEAAAVTAGARFVEVFLAARDDELAARFADRVVDQPWLEEVHRLVDAVPPGHVDRYAARLGRLAAARPGAVVLTTRTGDADGAYAELVRTVGVTLDTNVSDG